MSEFKDKIPSASGKVEFLYDRTSDRIALQLSLTGGGASKLYQVAVSMDGRRLLAIVPVTGIGVEPVYPRPSVLTFIQSDEQGMWGRNCPTCEKYFRTTHFFDVTWCPYCANAAPSLAFISKDQRKYIMACYDAFARSLNGKKDTAVEIGEITDSNSAWHYSEVKQQFHFKCATEKCSTETDILGEYGFCPQCCRTNARTLFLDRLEQMTNRIHEIKATVANPQARRSIWEEMTKNVVGDFEFFSRHLRVKLLTLVMTPNRRKSLLELNFQNPLQASQFLTECFDIGLLSWRGNGMSPTRTMSNADLPFVKKMIQKRHILIHNGGVVDQDYINRSGDKDVQLGERIGVSSKEIGRFIVCIRSFAENLADNVEFGFS